MMAEARLNGRYLVREILGAGTQGLVLLVEDRDGSRCALKVLRDLSATARTRLAAEFQRLAALDHPRLVRARELGTVATAAEGIPVGAAFFTADYVEGTDLLRFDAGTEDWTDALLDLAEDLASALAHLHAAGICHGDVTPNNVVVRRAGGHVEAHLIDLGLAAARGAQGQGGTPAYMAPEALGGAASPRADLFGLGATLYHAVCGAPPFGAGPVAAIAAAMCAGEAPPARSRAPWLPGPLSEFLARLLACDEDRRPSSAAAVLEDLGRLRETLARPSRRPLPAPRIGALVPPPLIGRRALLAELGERWRALAAGRAEPGLLALVGPPGAGKQRLVRESLQRHALAAVAGRQPPIEVVGGGAEALAGRFAPSAALDEEVSAEAPSQNPGLGPMRWADRVLAAAASASAAGPILLVCRAGEDERVDALIAAARAGHPATGGRLAVVAQIQREADAADDGETPSAHILPVPGLSPDELAELVERCSGARVEPAWIAELHRASGGLPGLALEVVRAAAARAGHAPLDATPVSALVAGGPEDGAAGPAVALFLDRVRALDPDRRGVLEGLAVAGPGTPLPALAALVGRTEAETCAALADLAARGLAELDGGGAARLASDARAHALVAAMDDGRRRALHQAALTWLEQAGAADPIALVRHRRIVGPAARAARECLAAARVLVARGQPSAARELAAAAAELGEPAVTSEASLLLCELAGALGDYPAAERAATAAAGDPALRRRALLAAVRIAQRAGNLDEAERRLAVLAEEAAADAEVAGLRARLLVSRGRYQDALAAADGDAALADGDAAPADALRLEAAGLAHLYLGEHDRAEARFRALGAVAERTGDRTLRGRAWALAGMVAHARGDLVGAAGAYGHAAAAASAASAVHPAAVYALNLATAHSERGRFAAALAALDEALVALRRLGDVAELPAALFNRGIALLALGEIDPAARMAEAAHAAATRLGTPQMQIYAGLLAGDVERRRGEGRAAAVRYQDALQLAREAGPREQLVSLANLAEVRALIDAPGALALVDEAESLARSDDDRDRVTVARARVVLALGAEPGDVEDRVLAVAERAATGGRSDLGWRAALLGARLALARGDAPAAGAATRRASALWAEILAETPESWRAGLRTDPDAQALAELEAQPPGVPVPVAPTAAPRPVEARLRRLLALGRRLNSELRLGPLLDDVIDTVIEMTSAERGFLLLLRDGAVPAPDSAGLEVVVARNFEHSALDDGELGVSRSIADRAARTGEVVLTIDAEYDDRWGGAASVAALRLRSVLAVPLRRKGRIIGTIYVDHRFRRGAFDDEAIELVRELADIAAIAIDNARLVAENQRRQEEIAALNRRLEAEVVEKEAELASVKARLDAGDRASLRHAYDEIIGRSPDVLDMLRVVDRAAETSLPVVVFGESGTGKELVARALHRNGPRRDGPFVAVNCGAVPEPLLESELFGHVRGAFTGADRDRRGLFEVADGGTLFLDEVADTSLAMQAKLLRVLQEREIRRVGDERPRPVDVRIVAASNRKLAELVAEGRFREDLFYRLDVLHVDIPPLRDRVEDIEELSAHILRRLAGPDRDPPRLGRGALGRLCAYAWPGNVRELENELARAFALGGPIIEVGDLSPRLTTAAPAPRRPSAADLALKPRLEALERELVEEALRRTEGNQTAAAKLLGLSRYGLQKKLKRLAEPAG